MPYVLKKYNVIEGGKVEDFLVDIVKLSETLAHKLLQKGRIIDNNNKRLE